MPFLQPDYKNPSGASQFMKLQDGKNRFRVLTDAIVGWEGWKNKKPFRRPGVEKNIEDYEVDLDSYGKPNVKHFWAFGVWNMTTPAKPVCQILEITQVTIMRAIENYITLEEYGDPQGYDLIITSGKDKDGKVTYNVAAMPPKETPQEAIEALMKSKIDLNKLFEGEYPMQATDDYDSDPLMQ